MLIPKAVFCISRCCAPDNGRYVLGAVRLERNADGAPHAIVCDGKRLVAVRWDDTQAIADYPADVLPVGAAPQYAQMVPRKAWDEVGRLTAKVQNHKPVLTNAALDENHADKLALAVHDGETTRTLTAAPVEGKYPDWREVIPEYEQLSLLDLPQPADSTAVSVVLDARLLAEVATVVRDAAAREGEHAQHVRLTIPVDGQGAVVIQADGLHSATGVLMPVL